MENPITLWTNELLTAVLDSYDLTHDKTRFVDPGDDTISTTAREIPNDPAKLEYLRKLIAYVLDGRTIAAQFNYVVLATVTIFAVLHWKQRFGHARRRRHLAESTNGASIGRQQSVNNYDNIKASASEGSRYDLPSSSSSSTRVEIQSPGGIAKVKDLDLERQPLLGHRKKATSLSYLGRLKCSISAWLMYQPRPIPIINRVLPSNGTSVFVLGYIAINVFLHLYRGSLRPEYEFAFADRAGYIFVVNLPLLYLLAAKNQPLKLLTGYSYEALNIFHRRVGEWMCFEAAVHTVGMILGRLFFLADWLKTGTFREFMTHPLILLGLGAFFSYELLFFTSLGSFRQRWYELFLASHVVLQVAALLFLYLHFPTTRPYVFASLVIFTADRVVWRLGLKSASMQAHVRILEDGKTFMLSANWDIPSSKSRAITRWLGQSVIYGWRPMDHVFITVPSLGRGHGLQAHPFTIASAAPGVPEDSGHTIHAWLNLLIRAQDGFTADLLKHARLNSAVTLRVDGPYGSADALEMLLASDITVVIAGGSGIAVIFPLVWDLAHRHASRSREIHLLWIVHSRSHRSWMPQDQLDDLVNGGVRFTIPEPTAEVGRPDVDSYVAELGGRALQADSDMGVVVSGPDALNRTARNACARAVRKGVPISLRVEKFGW
ncbi:hypothetical protein SCUP234_01942 [Seiridium cupressi]